MLTANISANHWYVHSCTRHRPRTILALTQNMLNYSHIMCITWLSYQEMDRMLLEFQANRLSSQQPQFETVFFFFFWLLCCCFFFFFFFFLSFIMGNSISIYIRLTALDSGSISICICVTKNRYFKINIWSLPKTYQVFIYFFFLPKLNQIIRTLHNKCNLNF